MEAKAVKSLLEVQYGITPVLLIDNFLCKKYPDKIRGLDALKNSQYKNVIVLVVSDLVTVHNEILAQLYALRPTEQCIDLLKESYDELVADARANFPETLQAVMDKMQSSGMMKNGMVYHPKNTHALVYLPFAMTDSIQRCLLQDDYSERDLLTKIFAFDHGRIARAVRNRAVLDIGANIGNHSLYFTIEAGARKVVSFEPVSLTFSILKRNVELNHLEDRIELHNCGLGKEDLHAIVPNYNTRNIGGTTIQPSNKGNIVIRKLDEMELPTDISLIKIDVEGMELDVVKGAMATLRAQHPFVMMESFEENAPKMIEVMGSIGYQCKAMDEVNYLFY